MTRMTRMARIERETKSIFNRRWDSETDAKGVLMQNRVFRLSMNAKGPRGGVGGLDLKRSAYLKAAPRPALSPSLADSRRGEGKAGGQLHYPPETVVFHEREGTNGGT